MDSLAERAAEASDQEILDDAVAAGVDAKVVADRVRGVLADAILQAKKQRHVDAANDPTKIDVAGLRALCAAAPPGPWAWTDASFLWNTESDRGVLAHGEEVAWGVSEADREFIAAARAALPALLDRLSEAEGLLKAPELHWDCQQRIDALESARDEACNILIAIDRQRDIGADRIVRVHELLKVGRS